MPPKRFPWLLLAVVFAIATVIFTFSTIVTDPAHTVNELGGDAAKNIYTYLYHSMYGHGYWFEGMNYPYGEHIVYTDGQPPLSLLLANTGHVSATTALAIMWLLIGFSYVLCNVYLYRILVHFGSRHLPAILFASLITIFSPQIFRVQSHFALSYACFIPMLFYWNVRYFETTKVRYCLYISATGSLMAFFHLYFAAMLLFWALSYAAGYTILMRKERLVTRLRHVIPVVLAAVCVFACLSVWIKLTDPIHDRPVSPFATTDTNTHLKQIFTSAHSPFWHFALDKHWVPSVADKEEGYVYLGVVMGIVLTLSLAGFVLRLLRKKTAEGNPIMPPVWIFVAVAVLLLSMGIPFIWHMQWLMDIVPAFKQFRSMGRFSWVFYYIMAIYTALAIDRYASSLFARHKKALAYGVYFVTLGLWSLEAAGYVGHMHWLASAGKYNYETLFSKNSENWTDFLEKHNHKGSDFQSIILLPYIHVGSEKLWVGGTDWIVSLGIRPALELHLPVVDVMMSRSSWSQTFRQVRTAAGPYADKPLLREIKSDKPFLLLQFDEDSTNEDQKYLLAASDYIGHLQQCNVYACYPSRVMANDKKHVQDAMDIAQKMNGTDTCVSCDGGYFIQHFNNGLSAQKLFGSGAAAYVADKEKAIAEMQVKPVADSQRYEISAWFLLGTKDYKSPYVTLQMLDSAGNTIATTDALGKQSVDNYDMWFRCSAYFYMPRACRMVRCKLINELPPTYIAMDELQLRPAAGTIISQSAGRIMVNNHLLIK